jgi:transcription termination factor Rho
MPNDQPRDKGGNKGGRSRWNRNRHRSHNNNSGPKLPMLAPEVPVYDEHQLSTLLTSELQAIAKAEGVRQYWCTPRETLMVEIIKQTLRRGAEVHMEGVVQTTPEFHGYIRSAEHHFQERPSDPFLPVQLMRKYNIQSGNSIRGKLRQPRGGDRQLVMNEILEVEGQVIEQEVGENGEVKVKLEEVKRTPFEQLTAIFPDKRLFMEIAGDKTDMTRRVIDLITPIGMGQRGLIVAPPRVGKTVMMKKMIQSIEINHPEVVVIVLLIDERPEEVTDLRDSVQARIVASTFDEKPQAHIQAANMALSHAKVLVEKGQDVVLFVDSITRLTRAFNHSGGSQGRLMSGGIDTASLQKVKQFLGTARNIENGGSLTILGTTLVDTGSRMDQVIFEEFKGTGNMDLYLDRELAAQRIYPAVNIPRSGTRKDELLMPKDEYEILTGVRKTLGSMIPKDAVVNLIDKLSKTGSNAEFLMGIRNSVNQSIF